MWRRVAWLARRHFSSLSEKRVKLFVLEQTRLAEQRRVVTKSPAMLERHPDALVAAVDKQPWDLDRALPTPESLVEYRDFSHPEGASTFWHSAAHILGQALERHFEAKNLTVLLKDGPALEEGGFFYDCQVLDAQGNQVALTQADLEVLTTVAQKIVKERQVFTRIDVTKDFARMLFKDNPLKLAILDNIPDDDISVYRCGRLVDLCRGPHIPNTDRVEAFELTKVAACTQNGVTYQRVYGIAFPSRKLLNAWKQKREAAALADHRVQGKAQGLFMFHETSPGCAFFLPHGTRVYNALLTYLRSHYRAKGYDEVQTPLMFYQALWETSGHWENYKDDMFTVWTGHEKSGDPQIGLKPMNCPSHCLIFDSELRSYRDLPIRYADFSPLHRNEVSGALTGLTRVRKFEQDDGHIFCREDQIQAEILGCLRMIGEVYGVFGFEFKLFLSTRPEKYLGELETWNRAEAALKQALENFDHPYQIKEGDGAFYGPKIDVGLLDAFGRQHQCGTVQLDFQLPKRFKLGFKARSGEMEVPVLIHRAVLGSVERMMAILIEHYNGRWPLWLSPRQVRICPLTDYQREYANQVRQQIHDAGFFCDIHPVANPINKQVRIAQRAQYNYIVVIGNQEATDNNISVRSRTGEILGTQTVPDFIRKLTAEREHFQ